MSRYFSKLAKRTGISAHRAERIQRPTTRADMRQASPPHKNASSKYDLEINLEKIAAPVGPSWQSASASEANPDSRSGNQSPANNDEIGSVNSPAPQGSVSAAGEQDPPQPSKTVSEIPDPNAEGTSVQSQISETSVQVPSPQSGVRKDKDELSMNKPQGGHQSHESLSPTESLEKDPPDSGRLIEKQQYTADPGNRAQRQTYFNQSEVKKSLSPSHSEQPRADREIKPEGRTIISEIPSDLTAESGWGPLATMSAARIKETPDPASATPGVRETKPPHQAIRTTRIVSENGPAPQSGPAKQDSSASDGSIAVRIGTISFELNQPPVKITAANPPAPMPRPVVNQKTDEPQTLRLSRYYLKGL